MSSPAGATGTTPRTGRSARAARRSATQPAERVARPRRPRRRRPRRRARPRLRRTRRTARASAPRASPSASAKPGRSTATRALARAREPLEREPPRVGRVRVAVQQHDGGSVALELERPRGVPGELEPVLEQRLSHGSTGSTAPRGGQCRPGRGGEVPRPDEHRGEDRADERREAGDQQDVVECSGEGAERRVSAGRAARERPGAARLEHRVRDPIGDALDGRPGLRERRVELRRQPRGEDRPERSRPRRDPDLAEGAVDARRDARTPRLHDADGGRGERRVGQPDPDARDPEAQQQRRSTPSSRRARASPAARRRRASGRRRSASASARARTGDRRSARR